MFVLFFDCTIHVLRQTLACLSPFKNSKKQVLWSSVCGLAEQHKFFVKSRFLIGLHQHVFAKMSCLLGTSVCAFPWYFDKSRQLDCTFIHRSQVSEKCIVGKIWLIQISACLLFVEWTCKKIIHQEKPCQSITLKSKRQPMDHSLSSSPLSLTITMNPGNFAKSNLCPIFFFWENYTSMKHTIVYYIHSKHITKHISNGLVSDWLSFGLFLTPNK